MNKTSISCIALLVFSIGFSTTVLASEDETYMNWSYASGIETPRQSSQTTQETLIEENNTGTMAQETYTNETFYDVQNVQPIARPQLTSPQIPLASPMAPMQPMMRPIPASAVQTSGTVQYVNSPVKVQYPITKQYPVSVQYPVTVQKDITVQRPVVMQQPIVVQRPVVMQQPVMVQHQPVMVQQQPIFMQQQPTFVQQQPIVVQASNTSPLSVQPVSVTGFTGMAVQSMVNYPAAYTLGY